MVWATSVLQGASAVQAIRCNLSGESRLPVNGEVFHSEMLRTERSSTSMSAPTLAFMEEGMLQIDTKRRPHCTIGMWEKLLEQHVQTKKRWKKEGRTDPIAVAGRSGCVWLQCLACERPSLAWTSPHPLLSHFYPSLHLKLCFWSNCCLHYHDLFAPTVPLEL